MKKFSVDSYELPWKTRVEHILKRRKIRKKSSFFTFFRGFLKPLFREITALIEMKAKSGNGEAQMLTMQLMVAKGMSISQIELPSFSCIFDV